MIPKERLFPFGYILTLLLICMCIISLNFSNFLNTNQSITFLCLLWFHFFTFFVHQSQHQLNKQFILKFVFLSEYKQMNWGNIIIWQDGYVLFSFYCDVFPKFLLAMTFIRSILFVCLIHILSIFDHSSVFSNVY